MEVWLNAPKVLSVLVVLWSGLFVHQLGGISWLHSGASPSISPL